MFKKSFLSGLGLVPAAMAAMALIQALEMALPVAWWDYGTTAYVSSYLVWRGGW